MPKINEMLLKLEGFQYAVPLDLNMGYYYISLRKTQVTYVGLFSLGENTVTIVYQLELQTHQTFYNRKSRIYLMNMNLSVHA